MPLSYKIDDGIVNETVIGKIDPQEQITFCQEWLTDPALPSPIKVLRDARDQVLDRGGFFDVHEIIAFANSRPMNICLAIVVSDELARATARIFQEMVKKQHKVAVFENLCEARAWLHEADNPDTN